MTSGSSRIALVIGWVAIVVVAFAFARVAAGRIETLAAAEAWSRRFTTDVSHELRTPVAALVSEASVLEQHLDRMPPERARAAPSSSSATSPAFAGWSRT